MSSQRDNSSLAVHLDDLTNDLIATVEHGIAQAMTRYRQVETVVHQSTNIIFAQFIDDYLHITANFGTENNEVCLDIKVNEWCAAHEDATMLV